MPSLLERVGRSTALTAWGDLLPATRVLAPYVILDALGCGLAGVRLGVLAALVGDLLGAGGPDESRLWGSDRRLCAAHAALANGAVAHHLELDDGDSRASLHGGVTVVPAALAVAEARGASGRSFLEAVAIGYGAAVACGFPLKEGVDRRQLHGPSQVGCLGAAAAAARLYGLGEEGCTDALAIAAQMMPFGPFEAFSKGAPVKDLFGGWPAFIGVTSAILAREGLGGAASLIEKPLDGLGAFLSPEGSSYDESRFDAIELDPDELSQVYFKPYSSCRATHPVLTALEGFANDPVAAERIGSIAIETYPFAVDLDAEAVSDNPIGARASLRWCAASMVIDGELMPEAFTQAALADPRRRSLEARVSVTTAPDMVRPVVRGARVTMTMRDGQVRRYEAKAPKWHPGEPATKDQLLAKFRRLAGGAAAGIETAVFALAEAPDLGALSRALGAMP
ncbi:MAG: MmgE/PrpD family protein [Spirochaetota bacterium]